MERSVKRRRIKHVLSLRNESFSSRHGDGKEAEMKWQSARAPVLRTPQHAPDNTGTSRGLSPILYKSFTYIRRQAFKPDPEQMNVLNIRLQDRIHK